MPVLGHHDQIPITCQKTPIAYGSIGCRAFPKSLSTIPGPRRLLPLGEHQDFRKVPLAAVAVDRFSENQLGPPTLPVCLERPNPMKQSMGGSKLSPAHFPLLAERFLPSHIIVDGMRLPLRAQPSSQPVFSRLKLADHRTLKLLFPSFQALPENTRSVPPKHRETISIGRPLFLPRKKATNDATFPYPPKELTSF